MDITTQIALLGTLFTFFVALITALVNFFRERSERERWRRTLELEEQRLKHEENRWALDLYMQREFEIFKMRLKTYPEVFGTLEKFSKHHKKDKIAKATLKELADKFNKWGYSEVGLCMASDTRDKLFELRVKVSSCLDGEIEVDSLFYGARTDLAELMRRDLSQNWSVWRQYKTLAQEDAEQIKHILGKS